MTANQLIQYATWAVYVLIFLSTAVKAVRRPLRANVDIALFFLFPTLLVLQTVLTNLGIEPRHPIVTAFTIAFLLLMGYMLLRLVDDFANVPPWLIRASEVLLALQIVATFATPVYSPTLPTWLLLIILAYLIVLLLYATVAFVRETRRTTGVTSRRMAAAAAGTFFLWLLFAIALIGMAFRELQGVLSSLTLICGLASGVCYFLGFAPPGVLRSAWQEPELRAFLSRAANLPRLPSTEAIVAELEKGASGSLGTPEAKIGLWNEPTNTLQFELDGQPVDLAVDYTTFTARAFLQQEPTFTDNLERDSPSAPTQLRRAAAKALLAAPISTTDRRLGVLVAYAPHAPVFADEDLRLVQLLADQAAVILESRALIDEATRVRTREEVTRLKEDFLSAAAHDLKTPLTTLVAQAQLLERRAERRPDAPLDREGIRTIAREATRLKGLVLELLDAARAEEGKLLGETEQFDIVAVAQEVCARHNTERHPCRVEADGAVVGTYDPGRIRQLLENLVENAVKYSPEGGEVLIKVWADNNGALFSVRDHGIGIPPADLSHVFDRFHRGTNVDDRRFAGMGLGLYICKEIVEQHGGRISVASSRNAGAGTAFTVELPLQAAQTGERQQAPGAFGAAPPDMERMRKPESTSGETLPNRMPGQLPLPSPEKGRST